MLKSLSDSKVGQYKVGMGRLMSVVVLIRMVSVESNV